jgi:uncharacterized protein GlcG (DUF336 family)
MRLALLSAAFAISLSGGAVASDALVTYKGLKPEYAVKMAQAALNHCHNNGFQVGVAVVDRFGVLQVFLRDQFAGAHTVETATRKAWTAVSFRTSTSELDLATRRETAPSAIRNISQALPLGGGMMVSAAGTLVAGIGVSGAPGGAADEECANAGIAAIQSDLDF